MMASSEDAQRRREPQPQRTMSEQNQNEQPPVSAPAVGSTELLGAFYHGSDGAVTCALCHCEMEWEQCSSCGGEGWDDAYEEDPLLYDPGDTIPCSQCNGRGGSWWCANRDCETGEGWKHIAAPKAPNAEVSEVAVTDSTKTRGVRPPLSLD